MKCARTSDDALFLAKQTSYAQGRTSRTLTTGISQRRLSGFTLLELMVVVVIIGLLAALVVPRYFNTVTKSKGTIARAQMDSLEKALEEYRLDTGALPTAQQGLQALVKQPAGVKKWQGPYLKKAIPLDPWGNAYIYKVGDSTQDPDIISLGSDGQPGGSGDAKDLHLTDTE